MEITNCAIPYLPDEIVDQILLRLPVKSLLRFRCVSKVWRDIIDGVAFANKHIAFGTEPPQILPVPMAFQTEVQALYSFIYYGNFIKESDNPVIEFSNNKGYELSHIAYGLLLYQNQNCREETLLCNPLRGEVLELPRASPGENYLEYSWYGMGLDSTTNTYKIVRVFPLIQDDHMSSIVLATEIYNMGTSSSWRRISSVPPFYLAKHGVSVYGDMHWSISEIDCYLDRTTSADPRMIVSFDFRKEEFIRTPPPYHLGGPTNAWLKLTNLRESLAIINFSSDRQFIDTWVMKDYNKKEWVREYRIGECQFLWNHINFSVGAWGPSFFLDPNDMMDNYLYMIDLKLNRIMCLICPWRDENSSTRTAKNFGYTYRIKIFSYTESILSLRNFGKLVSAAECRRLGFLKTA